MNLWEVCNKLVAVGAPEPLTTTSLVKNITYSFSPI
jgi:hypothetical protein